MPNEAEDLTEKDDDDLTEDQMNTKYDQLDLLEEKYQELFGDFIDFYPVGESDKFMGKFPLESCDKIH